MSRAKPADPLAQSRSPYPVIRHALVAALLLAVAPIGAVQAQEQSAGVMEEIVVTGIRRSLMDSVDFKRNAGTVVDAISAEELGKFPDINVAESLQRVTGVAITRTRGGEGQFVTVRGLGEEFNAVTYNGRLLATENNGREFSFDVIASELIAGAEVYKTATVSQGDGSLGGRVNIRPAKPLDIPGTRFAGFLGAQYEDMSDETGPRASGVFSTTWNDDTMGFLASYSYQDRDARTDVAESTFLVNDVQVDATGLAGTTLDADGDGLNDLSGAPIINDQARFNGFAVSLVEQQRERLGGTLAFQWEPSDRFAMTVDALVTTFDAPATQYSYSYFPSIFLDQSTGVELNDANQIVSHSSPPFATDLVVRENAGDADTYALGFNAEWQLGDTASFTTDVAYSKSDGQRDNLGSAGGSGGFFVIGYPEGFFTQTFTGRNVPDTTFTAANSPGGPQVPLSQLVPDDGRLHFARNDIVKVEDEVLQLRGDYEMLFRDDSVLKTGVEYVEREKTNAAFNNVPTQCEFCGYAIPFATFGNTGDLFRGFTPANFLSGISANIPRVFPRLNPDAIRAAYAQGAPDALTAVADLAASSVVDEKVLGAYVQVDFGGEMLGLPYTANAGVRFSYTDSTSTGFGNTLDDIESVVLFTDGNNQTFGLNPPGPVSLGSSYFDILPALNVAFDLTEDWIFRTSFSRSLSRPTLTDLSTFFSLASTNVGGEAITASNPELEAIRSNNVDFSLEWYGEGGTSASAALFYKDISDFVTQTVITQSVIIDDVTQLLAGGGSQTLPPQEFTFRLQAPQNGDKAEIYGLELAGQWVSPSGFGLQANATLADSSATSGGVDAPLENISDLSGNLSVFYENQRLSARLSFNHRSDYLVGQTFEGGRNEFVDDYQQFDLSVSYHVTDAFTLFLDGINITDEPFFRFSETRDFLEAYEENGARWVVGVRGAF